MCLLTHYLYLPVLESTLNINRYTTPFDSTEASNFAALITLMVIIINKLQSNFLLTFIGYVKPKGWEDRS